MLRSLALLPAFAAVVFGQGAPLPQTTTPDQPAITGCSGCYIIADVAQVIFADYTTTQTATAIASSGIGKNGSVIATTLFQALPPFSFNSAGLLSGQAVTGAYIPLTGTVITIGGATLTSPTAYNIFTQYTQYQLTQANGACSTSIVTVQGVSPPFSVVLEADAGPSAIFEAESSFIAGQPRLTCAVGGAVVSTTIPISVTTTTTTSSTSGIIRPTPSFSPIPETQSSAAATSSAAASSTTSDSGINLSMAPSGSGGSSPTESSPVVVQGAASGLRTHFSTTSAGVLFALFALPGLGAWLL